MLCRIPIPYINDASAYYTAIADLPWSAWLDSGGMARFDIMTASPQHKIVLHEDESQDVFNRLRVALGESVASESDIPFAGGALGYLGYEFNRRPSAQVMASQTGEQLPVMAMGIYDWALVVDHQRKTAQLVTHHRHPETASLLEEVKQRLLHGKEIFTEKFRVQGRVDSNFSREKYDQAFAQVKAYLRAGDCYQVNLAQCFSAKAEGDALGAYLKLRQKSPAPYSAFLNLPHAQILCISPERFLSVRGKLVETRPIKGTRPRSSDAIMDKQLAEELRTHPKDRAENLMIVDLLRNDLGKSCVTGSVRVRELFEVESYANVHHLVSTIEGTILPERDALDLLRDCFPGGSITGAPKRRAMEIIEQLEPGRREVYCGAIGYIGFDGNMDTNIAIRTLLYTKNTIRCWAGGGIVADSDADAEYQETLDKASAMLALLKAFGGQ